MLRCVYLDLDGTLLGRAGSFLRDGAGGFSLLGARALEACHRAGVEVVFYSGRRRASLAQDARMLGVGAFVFEAGAGLVLDGETEWLTGELVPRGGRTIHDQITDTGAPALLLERYAGRLAYHDPWHRDREVSHLFRGDVDAAEAGALLAAHGHEQLRLLDNGASARGGRVLHLVPRAASKANGVARHMRARALAPEEVIAVGDSREDLGCADVVGTFWLVANALAHDPSLTAAIAGRANVRVADAGHGGGVYEAVVTTLAERAGRP